MTEQKSEVTPHAKERLKGFLEKISGVDLNKIDTLPQNIFKGIVMEIAQHPDDFEDYVLSVYEKMKEISGIDIKKEKDLNEKRFQDLMAILKGSFETFNKFAIELKKFNEKFDKEDLDNLGRFNNSFDFEKVTELIKQISLLNENVQSRLVVKNKEEQMPKKDPFKIMVPKNFWKEILKDESLLNEDEDY